MHEAFVGVGHERGLVIASVTAGHDGAYARHGVTPGLSGLCVRLLCRGGILRDQRTLIFFAEDVAAAHFQKN